MIIRDDPAEARQVDAGYRARHPGYSETPTIGTPDEIAESLVPYVNLGFRHIFFDAPAPFDDETIERFVGEVKPGCEGLRSATARR